MTVLAKAARVAFAFLLMNCEAVVGLAVFLRGKSVWRES
jgi:hypothetical protein